MCVRTESEQGRERGWGVKGGCFVNHKEMGIRKEIQKKAVLGWGDGWKGSQEANGAEGTRLRQHRE